MEQRNLYKHIWSALAAEKSMLFLAGPRQAGKTTLAKIIAESFTNKLYFNWDIPQDRKRFFETPSFFEQVERHDDSAPLIIFDEIHKYRDWKNYLKALMMPSRENTAFLSQEAAGSICIRREAIRWPADISSFTSGLLPLLNSGAPTLLLMLFTETRFS